jgi:hypothetical protein
MCTCICTGVEIFADQLECCMSFQLLILNICTKVEKHLMNDMFEWQMK